MSKPGLIAKSPVISNPGPSALKKCTKSKSNNNVRHEEQIDEEVSKLIESAYKRTKEILSEHKAQLDTLALRLLDREVLFKEDLEEIFGKRPWKIPEPIAKKENRKTTVEVPSNGAAVTDEKKENAEPAAEKPVIEPKNAG